MATFRQQIAVFTDANLSPGARARQLADAARAGLHELQAAGRAGPAYLRTVDGVPGATEDQVHAGGYIQYDFTYVGEAAAFALAFLRARAPVDTGRYHDSFYVAVDGRLIMGTEFAPQFVPPNAQVIIGNTQPYSRKIDVQLSGGRKLTFSVPPGLFDDAVKAVNGRFGNSTRARRINSAAFPGQYLLRRTQMRKGRLSHLVRRSAGTPVDSPAMVISVIE